MRQYLNGIVFATCVKDNYSYEAGARGRRYSGRETGGSKMTELMLVVAFSFSAGSLVMFLGLGLTRFRSRRLAPVRRRGVSECLGEISKRHDEYCSTVCPVASRCMLLAMDEYMRKHPGIMFSQDSFEQS